MPRRSSALHLAWITRSRRRSSPLVTSGRRWKEPAHPGLSSC